MDRTHPDSWQTLRHFPATNMTLRDYFAGQYLAGISSHPTVEGSMDEMAKWAYQMADAMIAAREVHP